MKVIKWTLVLVLLAGFQAALVQAQELII